MEIAESTSARKLGKDWLGVVCSVGCAIHCAAMPVLLSVLPSLTAVRWMADPLFHQVVAVVCATIVVLAILPAWRKHRSQAVASLAGMGIGLLFVAAFILPDQCCAVDHAKENAASDSGVESSLNDGLRIPTQLASFPSNKNALAASAKCDDDCVFCRRSHTHEPTYSRPLFTVDELQSRLGSSAAQRLIDWQPFLSPLGGVMLILGHLVNIRLQSCGCSAGCGSSKR